MFEGYDTAQICLNGHMRNDSIKNLPENNEKFCKDCGRETITQCLNCSTDIQGHYYARGLVMSRKTPVPSYCPECGHPYPWLEEKLKTATELANEIDDLSDEDKNQLIETLPDLVAENPRTILASNRFGKILAKTSKGVGGMLKEVLVDVLSETAKKILYP